VVSFRRPETEARIEIMPLIDVIFLLLTFFIYAMVLMVRAELLPMELQSFSSAEAAEPQPAATISITLAGTIALDRETIALDQVGERLEAIRAENPETVLYLALEAGQGEVDRAPLLTSLWDQLQGLGLEIKFVGRPDDESG
jgi:biopolymer transport protein ExbD